MHIRRLFRKDVGPSEGSPLNSALESESERLRKADPDTERQWQYLRIALERVDAREERSRTRPKFLFRPGFALGLAVVALAAAGVFLFKPGFRTISYATGRGELSTVLLPDSSEVTLNHTSELVIDGRSGRESRHVQLKGEAFFRVRAGSEPFVVSTDAGTVRVLGTQFNVRIRGGGLEVAVLGGRVSVTGGADMNSSVVLLAGMMMTCVKGGPVSLPEKILFADYPGWINHKLLFQRSSLVSVCGEIEDRFGAPVRIEKPALRDETITGALDSRSAEAAVAALAALTGSTYRHEANGFVLY